MFKNKQNDDEISGNSIVVLDKISEWLSLWSLESSSDHFWRGSLYDFHSKIVKENPESIYFTESTELTADSKASHSYVII